jgi:hypothetical protein
MTDWYKRQTPNNKGIWYGIESTYNIEESDYIIIQETTDIKNVDKNKTIFFGKEPDYIAKNRCPNCFRNFHFELGNSWFPQTWWVNINYDELKSLKPNKTKKLSAINSQKIHTKGQSKRYEIIKKISKKYPNEIDVWGGITTGNKNKVPFKDKLPPRDKKNGLLPYKYHLAVENGSRPFYFSEKIVDPLLCWSMPIYWGCEKIDSFLPNGSYINIDIDDPHVVEKIIEISKSNLWEENFNKIKEAREIILDKYNIWPTIESGIKKENLLIDLSSGY